MSPLWLLSVKPRLVHVHRWGVGPAIPWHTMEAPLSPGAPCCKSKGHDGQPSQRRLPRWLLDSLSAQPLRSADMLFTYSIGLEPYCMQVSLPGPGDININ